MHLLIFGLGYTAARLARRVRQLGGRVTTTNRSGTEGGLPLDSPAVAKAIDTATHILSSVPPADGTDPVLALYSQALATAPAQWLGYLSSTGVYGDTGGAWADETAPLDGRRTDRIAADLMWQALRPDVRIFRLPGIYGPGRSAIEQVRRGTAHRVEMPGQRFSRIHVDDIGTGVMRSFDSGTGGVYNLADCAPAAGRTVVEYACDLLGYPYPPLITPDSGDLSSMARGFYTESRLIATGKACRELDFTPTFADYRVGLRACLV